MRTSDYAKVNPVKELHPNEPFFFIRAQDKLSVDAVIAYGRLLQREANKAALAADNDLHKTLCEQSAEVMVYANKFMDWQEENPDKVKFPD